MADVKISALPAATTPLAGTEVLPIVQSATTRQVSVANLTAGRSVGGTNFIPSGSSAPTNGMFLPAANNLGFSTNSIEQMRIDSSGNLLVGTTTPVFNSAGRGLITINGSSAAAVGFTASGVDKGIILHTGTDMIMSNSVAGAITFQTTNTERMRITSAGNVGIGTSSPATKLNIENAGECQLQMAYSSTIFGRVGRLSSGNYEFSSYENGGSLLFGTTTSNGSTTERMRIDSSGNVGIGTSSPSSFSKLAVSGAANVYGDERKVATLIDTTALAAGVGAGISFFGVSESGGGVSQFGSIKGIKENATSANYAGALAFVTSTSANVQTERMRIDSSGNLGIGTTSPSYRLDVFQSGSVNVLQVQGNATDGSNLARYHQSANSGDNGFIAFLTETSPTARGSITYNRAGGLVAYNVTSDYRAKDIYGPVVDSGALIDATPVYMGKMKDATQERPMFLAHETPNYAHTGVKDAVDADGKPVYQQMDASALIPVMWAEIQSLRQRIKTLENK